MPDSVSRLFSLVGGVSVSRHREIRNGTRSILLDFRLLNEIINESLYYNLLICHETILTITYFINTEKYDILRPMCFLLWIRLTGMSISQAFPLGHKPVWGVW